MLFQPFITFVVLTINLSSIYAMIEQNKQSQQATVPIAVAMNLPSDNIYPSAHPKTRNFHRFGRKKNPVEPQNINLHGHPPAVPIAAAMNNPQYNIHRPHYQSPHNAQFANHQPLNKISPPNEDPNFSWAKCGLSRYNKDEIIAAREEGCRKMPFYYDNIVSRKAVAYFPANPTKYKGDAPFYLYPIGHPFPGITRTPHYGFDRIVLNQWCQAVNVVTERPHITEMVKKIGKYLSRRPVEYHQKKYDYVDCRLE